MLHPPAPARAYRCDGYGDYVFAVSRLTPLKRFDLLLDALAQPIARGHPRGDRRRGRGSATALLEQRRRLGLEDRVELVGRLDDAQLLDHLARCRAVAFVPLDEDYGFVTVEAFAAHKPVVTCRDSGGPTELVADGVHGLVAAPTRRRWPPALRRMIDDRGRRPNGWDAPVRRAAPS